MAALDIREILDAARRLEGRVLRTPTVHSQTFGGWLKLESVQHTGAYKVRGALNALTRQVERGDHRPVVAASAGNHGAGVAWAARALGLRACVIVPLDAPRSKTRKIEGLGAEVRRVGEDFDASLVEAQRLAIDRGWRLLHAFDDRDVIAGQGSIGLEVLEVRPDLVLVPIGGGGLASGVGSCLKAFGVPVVGVQVQGVHAMARALGRSAAPLDMSGTVADGVKVRQAGALTRRVCAEVLDDIIIVTEAEVQDAMRAMALDEHLVAEGAGALAVAGLAHVTGRRKVAVVSGGNVDARTLVKVLGSEAGQRQSARRQPLPKVPAQVSTAL